MHEGEGDECEVWREMERGVVCCGVGVKCEGKRYGRV